MFRISSVDRFGVLLCSSAILEQIPHLSWRTFLFVGVLLWLVFSVLLQGRLFIAWSSVELLLLAFVMVVAASALWALSNGVNINQWARGTAPFSFLLLFFTINRKEPFVAQRMVKFIGLAAAIWLIRLMVELFYRIASEQYDHSARMTGQIVDSVIPYTLVAWPFLFAGLYTAKVKIHYLIGLGLLVVTIFSGYRSQVAIVIIQSGLIAASGFLRKSQIVRFIGMGVALLFLTTLYGEQAIRGIVERYQSTDLEFESSRLAEWNYAVKEFLANPILGRGIGWQVPDEVTFAGALEKLEQGGIELPSSAGYLHNLTGYLLMDLGLIGFGLYYGLIFLAIFQALSKIPRVANEVHLRNAALLALASLLVYFQVQAAFRLIQVNLLLIALLSILTSFGMKNHSTPVLLQSKSRKMKGC